MTEELLFPKSQLHEVGPPVDKSIYCTTRGAQPVNLSAVKLVLGWLNPSVKGVIPSHNPIVMLKKALNFLTKLMSKLVV